MAPKRSSGSCKKKVLMDCQMPVMDGYEATIAIRKLMQSNEVRHIPILALTANAMIGDREKCFEAGMDDFITKPVKSTELAAALARWLPAERASSSHKGPGETQPDLDYLMLDGLRSSLGKSYPAYLALFMNDSEVRLEKIRTLIAADTPASDLLIDLQTLQTFARPFGMTAFDLTLQRLKQCTAQFAETDKRATMLLSHFEDVKSAWMQAAPRLSVYTAYEAA